MNTTQSFFRSPLIGVVIVMAWSLSQAISSTVSGPLPSDMAAWNEEMKEQQREAGKKLLAQIFEAVAVGQKDIRIPQSHYRFAESTTESLNAHIVLPPGMEGVTLDFQGSTLWFETEASGIVLPGAKNTTLRNVFLDWDPLPFLQGVVTAINLEAGTFDVALDQGYERALPPLMQETWRGRGVAFDRNTRELKSGQHGCEVVFSWASRQPDGSYRLIYHGFTGVPLLADSGISVGDPYVMFRRMQRGVRMERTENCTLEDVTLYSAPFVAFVHAAGGAPTFRRCNILRRPGTNRLIAGNADGINCDNMTKGPLIEDCRMETLGDDFVNVHGHLARVIWQEAPDEIVTTRMNRRADMRTPVTIEFFERLTMLSLGKRTATWVSTTWKIEPDRCLADLKCKWRSGDAAALSTDAIGKTLSVSLLKLDKPIEIAGDAIVVCEELSSPGTIIRNNDFRGSLARGLLLQSPHILVENNKISLTHASGIALGGQAVFWGEGPFVYDATIRNNTLDGISLGERRSTRQRAAIEVQESGDYGNYPLSRDIRIEGNAIHDAGGPAIVARGVKKLSIINNTVHGYGFLTPWPLPDGQNLPIGTEAAIVLESISGLVLEGNKITAPGPGAKGDPIMKIDIQD